MSSIADNNSQDASIDAYNGKVLLAAVICLSIVIFFVLLLHGYARWVLRRRPIVANVNVVTEPLHRRSLSTYPGYTTEVALPGNGLDAKLVASLPKFVYRSREHENGLHCVVCLSVMVEEEIGRLLPRCKHTFHVECIDMWLTSHSTCPICRAPVKLLTDGPASVGDGAPLVVLVEPGSANEELSDLSGRGTSVEGEVVVEMPIIGSDESSNSSSSSSSSSASTSSSSSVGCSLKRMLSRSRSESRVFPSLPVN